MFTITSKTLVVKIVGGVQVVFSLGLYTAGAIR
jgi:hypothetical protein